MELIHSLDHVFKGRSVKPSACIEMHSANRFYIEDNEQEKCCKVLKEVDEFLESKTFLIENATEQAVAFWKTDGCFMGEGKPPGICDCIVFSASDFCFVELKLNAYSLDPRLIQRNRIEAIDQLKKSILFLKNAFAEKKDFLDGYHKEAYVCTPSTYPRKNTALADFAVQFLDDYSIFLKEENKKTF